MRTLTFIPEQRHYRVKELDLLCSLPKTGKSGIVTIDNYSVGCGHSAHPNIDKSGSVKGMKNLGYWNKNDITTKQGGYIYNTTKIACSNLIDELCLAIERRILGSTVMVEYKEDGTVIYNF